MRSLLLFHSIAAQRGDGLRPELVALFERLAAPETDQGRVIESGQHRSTPGATQTATTIPPCEQDRPRPESN
jgi:hypothetical protein